MAAAAIAIGVAHHNRTTPIDANVAGQQLTLAPNTTYQDLIDNGVLTATVGDLVAVDQTTVLTVGGGNSYVVSCNDKPVDNLSRRVKQNGTVTIAEGTDVMEDYTDETSPADLQYEFHGTGAISTVTQQGVAGNLVTRTGSVSGMTVQFVDEDSGAQPYVIESYNVEPSDKLIALTFDDGPSEYTPKYLDILSQYGVKATFFMLGQEVEAYPDHAKRVSDEGHQLCTHSYSHANMYELDSDGVREEIQKGIDAINNATGVAVREMRAPYGNWGQEQWKAVSDLVDRQIIWNIDTEDWRRPGASAIVRACTNHAAPGKIILMHDGGGNREQDVGALPQIIEALQGDGYRFVTIDELDGSGDHVSA